MKRSIFYYFGYPSPIVCLISGALCAWLGWHGLFYVAALMWALARYERNRERS